jgi:hypothetical protein
MFKSFVVTIALLASNAVFARSLNPCTPNVQAAPTQISCSQKDLSYSIVINTLMSPSDRGCTGTNYYEYKTAKIEITDKNGGAVGSAEIENGGFDYNFDGTGKASFKSDLFKLNLKNCVSPLNGGFSVGNKD